MLVTLTKSMEGARTAEGADDSAPSRAPRSYTREELENAWTDEGLGSCIPSWLAEYPTEVGSFLASLKKA